MPDRQTVTSRELQKQIGTVIDRAISGETLTVTRHGRQVAVLGPVDDAATLTERDITVLSVCTRCSCAIIATAKVVELDDLGLTVVARSACDDCRSDSPMKPLSAPESPAAALEALAAREAAAVGPGAAEGAMRNCHTCLHDDGEGHCAAIDGEFRRWEEAERWIDEEPRMPKNPDYPLRTSDGCPCWAAEGER